MISKEFQPEITVDTEYDPSRGGYFAHVISTARSPNGGYSALEIYIPNNSRQAVREIAEQLGENLDHLDEFDGLREDDRQLYREHWPKVIEFLKR